MSGPGNFLPREFVDVHQMARGQRWEEARARFRRMLPLIRQIESGKYLPRIKYGCHLAGIDVGDPRPPLFALNESEKAALRDAYGAATAGA
jgi:4-hydroxy-tetrahydrodipicolinate synthase